MRDQTDSRTLPLPLKPVALSRDGKRLKRGQCVRVHVVGVKPYELKVARVSHHHDLVFSEYGYCFPAKLCEVVVA